MSPTRPRRHPLRRFGRALLISGGLCMALSITWLFAAAEGPGVLFLSASVIAIVVGVFALLVPLARDPGQALENASGGGGFTGWNHQNSQTDGGGGGVEASAPASASDSGSSGGGDGGGSSGA